MIALSLNRDRKKYRLCLHSILIVLLTFFVFLKGFWQVDQPDAKKGQCVRAFTANADQSWALSSCESLLPFVCRAKACPKSILISYSIFI